MTISLKKHKDDLLFLPLGGSGEIGMNVNLYHLDGKWLMCDLGAGFADDWLPGVDMIVADISFIRERRDQLIGLVLTHAHEDHLGAVQYLWEELECPVYATPFTAAFLRAKLQESDFAKEIPIIEVKPGSKFDLEPFQLELVEITHSVPEMNGIIIRTRHGTVLHTGDWKLDEAPMVGSLTDEKKLNSIGDEGVLAMISDSTNIFSPGHSRSEGDLRESMIKLVAGCKQLVAVTTFASNVARIETIAKAAEAAGRRVALSGRSLHRIKEAAKMTGYLQDLAPFIDIKEVDRYPRNQVLVMCTGCQGEGMASTNKLATGAHPYLKLKPQDTMIFSSKVIPGNEKRIYRLFNLFAKMGVEVMTERDHFVHVSGHPNVEDVKRMYEMVRPKISIPVHGELVHMHEHARLAKLWGIPHSIQTENGEIIKLAPGTPERLGLVESGYYGVDGNYFQHPDGNVMRMRRRIQREGVIVVTLVLDKHMALAAEPVVIAPGALDSVEDHEVLAAIVDEIQTVVQESTRQSRRIKQDSIENITRSAIRRIVKKELGKNPPIEVRLARVY